MTGSMYSSKFSNRNGKPYWMAISRCFRKSLSLKVFTRPSSCLPSLFLIQYTACKQAHDCRDNGGPQLAFVVIMLICRYHRRSWRCRWPVCALLCSKKKCGMPELTCICGSIQSGQRFARTVRIPFWMDRSSDGSPWLPHSVVSTSLVSNVSSLQCMHRVLMSLLKPLSTFSRLN